jgi:hypothetical protein
MSGFNCPSTANRTSLPERRRSWTTTYFGHRRPTHSVCTSTLRSISDGSEPRRLWKMCFSCLNTRSLDRTAFGTHIEEVVPVGIGTRMSFVESESPHEYIMRRSHSTPVQFKPCPRHCRPCDDKPGR